MPAGGDSAPIIAAPAPEPTDGGSAIPLDGFVMGDANGDTHAESEHETDPAAVETECAAVMEWRREFAKSLEEKTANERRVKAERAERARETLASLHATWQRGAKDSHDANLDREKEQLRDRDAVLAQMSAPGEPPAWRVIPELVDMTGKFKEGARDTSRMRQVLMKMKTY